MEPTHTRKSGWGLLPLPGHKRRRLRARAVVNEVIGPRPTAARQPTDPDSRQQHSAQSQALVRGVSTWAAPARDEPRGISLDDRLAIAVKALADRGAAQPDLAPSFAGSPSESLVRVLVDASQFTPIQAATLSAVMSGRDFIGHVPQGVERHLAYAIPLLHQVVAQGEPGYDQLPNPSEPQAVVAVPTSTLALAVANHLTTLTKSAKRTVRIVPLDANDEHTPEVTVRPESPDVAVGTVDHLVRRVTEGLLNLDHTRLVVLDGADEMDELGLLPDVEALLARTPARRRTMLFSTTMPDDLAALAQRTMHQPVESPTPRPKSTTDDRRSGTRDESALLARRISKRQAIA
ncbi:DEAD/DEAH box helicase [Promicromonospora sp. NPDC060271]|uniref:DEAD/DEAH box helicase n=1 Tax=Promicromonospora sp. NPDC060271 TaxID=3347089 RepID=UPI0036687B4E